MSSKLTYPEIIESLVEAFKIGYDLGVEDCRIDSDHPGCNVNIENAALMFKLKLHESLEFLQLVDGETIDSSLLAGSVDNDTLNS